MEDEELRMGLMDSAETTRSIGRADSSDIETQSTGGRSFSQERRVGAAKRDGRELLLERKDRGGFARFPECQRVSGPSARPMSSGSLQSKTVSQAPTRNTQMKGMWADSRSILIRLIPVNLLLGILPTSEALEEYNLTMFQPLLYAFSTGNVLAWRRELAKQTEWLRARSIWLILFERAETLVWRNLFRAAWSQYMVLNPMSRQKTQCPTWVLQQAVQRCFEGSGEIEDGTIGIVDVVDILATLIDHVSEGVSCVK